MLVLLDEIVNIADNFWIDLMRAARFKVLPNLLLDIVRVYSGISICAFRISFSDPSGNAG